METPAIQVDFDPFAVYAIMRRCVVEGCRGNLAAERIPRDGVQLSCTNLDCGAMLIFRRSPTPPGFVLVSAYGLDRAAPPPLAAIVECAVPDCPRLADTNGICHAHASRWRRSGRPDLTAWIAAGGPKPPRKGRHP